MILIFFLCLKLSILHSCVSDLGYQCTRNDSSNHQIFLIEDRNNQNQKILNKAFNHLCRKYYNIDFVSLEESEKHHNVIHFAVPDYYDGKPLKNFEYAGNISKLDDVVCKKTDKPPPKFDCNEIVNLVSKSVSKINDGHVYNFVQEMQIREYDEMHRESCEPSFRNISDLTTVLLCLEYDEMHRESCEPSFRNISDLTTVLLCLRGSDVYKEVNIQPLQLIQVPHPRCSKYRNDNRLLAVLAPEPFEIPSEYSVPTIFYETPYLFSEYKTAFPNSMNLVPWRLLKYGFLKFIQTVGWKRVAIVTDDSEYSLDFEDELTALFNKERIIYTVIRCEDANCEMDKIAHELNTILSRIVIANVEEKHAQYLFQNTHHQITWLVRDIVGGRKYQYLAKHRVVLSFSLSTDTYTKGCGYVEDNILTGLSSIAQAYKNIPKEDYKANKRDFYRHFAANATQVTPRITEAKVVVYRLHSLEVVSVISVNATGAILVGNPFRFVKPTDDGTALCLLTSYDYHKPCEDPLVMFFMFTLMLFMLTFLLITCYFDKTSPFNDIRYHNF